MGNMESKNFLETILVVMFVFLNKLWKPIVVQHNITRGLTTFYFQDNITGLN